MRVGKALVLCVFIVALPASITAQGLFLADYRVDTTGTLNTSSGIPLASSAGYVTAYAMPCTWLRFRALTAFQISDFAAFLHPQPNKDQTGSIDLEGLSVEMPYLGMYDTALALYSGYYDDLLSDSLLETRLKKSVDEPEFQDLPAGNLFLKDTDIDGVGFAVQANPMNNAFATGIYAITNAGSSDALTLECVPRCAFTTDIAAGNAFFGATFTPGTSTIVLRGGVSALLAAPSGHELFFQAGINRYTVGSGENPGRKLFLLFEPRLHFGSTDLILSFFSSPIASAANPLFDGNYLGGDILLAFGSVMQNGMRGGISVLGMINPEKLGTMTPFTFSLTPFYTFRVADTAIEMAAKLNPLGLSDPGSAIELRISVKAVY